MPRPKWGEVREFCLKQGYRETHTDHFRYLKVLPGRTPSGTMVSMGADGEDVSPAMWQQVWKKQLRLASEDEFWKGLRGELVQYAIPPTPAQDDRLPDYQRRFLENTLHFTEAEIKNITREQAQNLLNEYYARDLQDD